MVPMLQFLRNLLGLLRWRVHKPAGVSVSTFLNLETTHLRLTLFLTFFLRLSLVTNSSASSLNAYCDGCPLNLKVGLFTSCRTTSSTVRAGSIRVRTVTPSSVVTLLVGTRADGLLEPTVEVEVVCRSDMARGWRATCKRRSWSWVSIRLISCRVNLGQGWALVSASAPLGG